MQSQELVQIIDFWLKIAKKNNLYERTISQTIHLPNKEVIDIVGVRRGGKSSLCKLLIKNFASADNFLYMNFEDPFFISQNSPKIIEQLVQVFQEYFSKDLRYLFFDEIQEILGWEKAVRKLRETEQFSIVITGSSSTLLSQELSSRLTGRHRSFTVYPLSFREFLQFRGQNHVQRKNIIVHQTAILKEFNHFLRLGGFPEIVATEDLVLLKQYVFDIVQKDIIRRYDIRDKLALEKLLIYLYSNTSSIFSARATGAAFQLSPAVVTQYLQYFQDSFLVTAIPRFSFSLKTQQNNLKKIYALDTGMIQVVGFAFSQNNGKLLENVVCLELQRRGHKIYYYKTAHNVEVDFLVYEQPTSSALIQVAWTLRDPKTRQRELTALLEAMNELHLTQGLVLTYEEEEQIELNGKIIQVKPVYQWLLE
ncbi:MAG: ATP-binding protein [Patescibacteria group bacterium]|jgi:hypothetical protein